MDIGKEKPAIVVEPVEDPFRRETPDRETAPPSPREPDREPEEAPA